MKLLAAIFVLMAVWGFAIGHNGGAIMSLFMVGFTVYGAKQLRKRDIEFYMHPRSAQPVPNADTLEALREQGAEAARSTF